MFIKEIVRLDAAKRKITISLSREEVEKAFQNAEREVALLKRRPLGDKQLGENPKATEENAIATRATKNLAEQGCREAICEAGIRIVANPNITIKALAERERDFSFEAVCTVVPEFSLADYNELHVVVDSDLDVSEQDIDDRFCAIQRRSAKKEKQSGASIGSGDEVTISFDSYIDGKGYEGSSVEHFAYQMGSRALPASFEAGLLGMRAGDRKKIEFKVPVDFENEAIAGKIASFRVVVEDVGSCILPDIDDAFAQTFGYKDLAEWREKIRVQIAQEKKNIYETSKEKRVREELAKLLQGEISPDMITAQSYRLLEAFKQEVSQQQIAFEEYCRFLNTSEDDIRKEMEAHAAVMLKENLALESLFRSLNSTAVEKDFEKTIEIVSRENNMSQPIAFHALNEEQREAIREMTMHRIATEWLLANAAFEHVPSTRAS